MTENKQPLTELPLIDNGVSEKLAAEPKHVSGRRRLLLIPLLFALLFAGGVIGLYFQPPGLQALFRTTGLAPGGGTDTPIAVAIQQVTDREELAVVSQGDVVALGRIIPRGDIVTVATPFGSGDARVTELRVEIGQMAQRGDIVAVLDSLVQYQGLQETAEASVAVARASLVQTIASIRAARREAQAQLNRSIATETAAAEELERTTSLMERGVTTKAVLDSAIARATEAARDVEKNRATLSRYAQNSDGVQADIAVAEANLQAALAELSQAERDVEKAYVRAPITGTILNIHARPGERPDAEGVLDLGDTAQMTIEAEVYQTMIGRVAIGDPVTATAAAISGELKGRVNAIGHEISRQSITSDDPAANTDARVVDVIIALDEASSAKARRLTNLQVVTRIDAGLSVE